MDEKAAIERFLGLSMKVEQTVEKPSRFLIDRVQGEVQGFERAQAVMRLILAEDDPVEEGKANG
jgi:hypothetical protein